MPSTHAIALLLVTATGFYLYTRSWIRMELVSLLLLLCLLLLFHVFPFESGHRRLTEVDIFAAFGHPALIAICCLMVLARGLTMTGALEPAARLLARVWKIGHWLGLLVTLLISAVASGLINDTPVLVLLLPMMLSISERSGYPVSKSLMPVNFAILCGGMLTSIGTSTNLLVLSIAADLGMPPMGLLGFSHISFAAILVALPYLWLVAPRLLPAHAPETPAAHRAYSARILIDDADSPLAAKSLNEVSTILGRPVPLVSLIHKGRDATFDELTRLEPTDALVLKDTAQGLRDVAASLKVELYEASGEGRFVENGTEEDIELAEIVVDAESPVVDRTLARERFAERHGVVVIGISRGTEDLLRRNVTLGEVRLSAGDVLLVQGTRAKIEALRKIPGLLLLDGSLRMARSPAAPWAIGIMAFVVLASATKILPIHIAAFIGVVAMLIARCIRLDGLGRALSMEVVLLVVSSVALGQALVATGAAAWLAQGVTAIVENLPPAWQLAIFMTMATMLTNLVSNSAAATVGTPIAIATAQAMSQPIEPYVLAVLFGSNLSFATPMAYQTNMLVMKAANYRFMDFIRVGLPLIALMLVTLSILLTRAYGL